MQDENVIILEDWMIFKRNDGIMLNGCAYGHPRFPDGRRITTSIVKLVKWETGLIHTESGSIYKLGEKKKLNFNDLNEAPF